ncbi:MAG: hypothetical protein LBE13_11845 [Bacteroidales bacterium]|jgi:hypothetical protein|nr:hypothetical protein [Bacteroidales bacterium]
MRIVFVLFVSLSILGCGVSKDEYDRAISEATRLRNEVTNLNGQITSLQEELDRYIYGEERTMALIEQAYKNDNLTQAREHIETLLVYHPAAVNNTSYKNILKLIEQKEMKIKEAEAAVERERIRQQRLASIGNTVDNPILLDGQGQNLDVILKDLIFDRKKYDGKFISIQNTYFDQFGVNSSNFALGFGYLDDWCKDPETYEIDSQYGSTLHSIMEANNIYLLFHPSDQDIRARRFMIEIKGKYNTNRLKKIQFHVTGKFSIVGNIQKHILLISQFTYDETTYKGILP